MSRIISNNNNKMHLANPLSKKQERQEHILHKFNKIFREKQLQIYNEQKGHRLIN
jgi:hypothetical protein